MKTTDELIQEFQKGVLNETLAHKNTQEELNRVKGIVESLKRENEAVSMDKDIALRSLEDAKKQIAEKDNIIVMRDNDITILLDKIEYLKSDSIKSHLEIISNKIICLLKSKLRQLLKQSSNSQD